MQSVAKVIKRSGVPPILRWAGSKRRLIPILKPYWNKEHKRYVEPFAGSACLFFSLEPSRAILGDINPELILAYREIKHRLPAVLSELKGRTPSKEEYLHQRSLEPKELTPAARTARFIYLNRFCFNGLYRTNLKGQFNVPYGGPTRSGTIPSAELLLACSKLLQGAKLVNGDFESVLEKTEKGDLVYMDPPYAVHARRVFSEYDPSAFSTFDIARLRHWMEKLDDSGISFLVSYAESDEARVLKKGFKSRQIAVRRNIAGFVGHRVISNEILISNIKI